MSAFRRISLTIRPSARRALALSSALIVASLLALDRIPVAASGQQISQPPSAIVRLDPGEAERLAKEARAAINVTMAPGLEVSLWAPSALVKDPIAVEIDARGVMYVTSSPRTGLPLDIRQHPDWVPEVHTLTTVDGIRAFLKRVMAPGLSAQNSWLPDLNKDGSRDWRDLAGKQERVYRLQDTAGRGRADTSEIVVEGFVNDDPVSEVAGGVMVLGRDLLVGCGAGPVAVPRYQRRRPHGRARVDEPRLQHPPGVRRTRDVGHHDRDLTAGSIGKLATSD